jgi:hypothetical protein
MPMITFTSVAKLLKGAAATVEAVVAAINKKELLRKRAMAAAATLLGAVPATQAAKNSPAEPSLSTDVWSWDTSFLQYSEAERVKVSEPQIGVRRNFGDDRTLSILTTVDTISGSTPLGTLPATANTAPATMTSPSGHAVNPIIGKVPTSSFSDTRIALNSTYQQPLGNAYTGIIGGNVSKEHDFLSLGTNLTLNRDFNQKNTTLSLGVSPEYDIVTPHGGLPDAYGTVLNANEFNGVRSTKYLVGSLLGLTQVINRQLLMEWTYSPTYENGYLNDPYKLLSIVNTQGDPLQAIHEKRPGSRLEHSFYWLTRYNIREHDVFNLGLRYFEDNWGIHSQTIDFTYRWQYHPQRFMEPHVRYYHQSAADFFRIGLLQGQQLPNYASADYRLNEINGVTFGIRFGWTLQNGSELTLRAEYYTQAGEHFPKEAVGAQKNFDLFPNLQATILQVAYSFEPRAFFSKNK